MAVKAKAEITLASIRDVKSTTRYYLRCKAPLPLSLQSHPLILPVEAG